MRNTFTVRKNRVLPGWLAGLGLLVVAALPAAGQGWLGLSQSNYGGTNNAYVNPSSIADSRHRFYLNLAGADINFYNTYLQLNTDKRPWQSGFELNKNNLTEQGTSGPQSASITAEARLPSFMLTLGPRSAIAFTSRVRGFAQVSNVSNNLAQLARYGLGDAQRLGLANKLLDDNSFNLAVNGYHEFAFTYARVFTANTEHFFKGGLTLKYLVGLGSGYVLNEGTQYQVYGKDSIQLQTRQLSYGATDYRLYGRQGFTVGSLYGDQQLGRGYGADLGVTYEWRPDYARYEYRMDGTDHPDNTRNKYRLRLGLALTDLGAISYRNDQLVRQGQLANTKTVQLGHLDTLRFRTLQSLENTAQRLTGLSATGRQFTSYLPAALRFTADYRLAGPLYAGLLWTQSLLPARTIGSRTISSLALTPRLEFSRAELALPVILANNYQKVQVGAMLRLGPLVVGSDNLGGIFGITSATGADVYMGLALALHRHRIKDRDGDQVSNKLDQCPKLKGTWETRGCPDRDGDHVADAADECPDVAGLAQFRGCPDTDGDGLPDKLDACPTQPGPAALNGCPDRDKDSVKDSDDACPDTPGLPALHGCPDQDGDGVPDADDHCPTLAGPADHAGCPDTDGDGLYDDLDKCPAQPGPADNQGCPVVLDALPTPAVALAPPPAASLDTDADGLPDADDACPRTPGPAANHGCPVLRPEEIKVLQTAFANLEFELNKDVIRPRSLPALRRLAALLVAQPTYRLRLSGYTDNVGTAAANLLLAKKRALAVQRYLVQQGVPAAQLRTEWFGRARPVASNRTAAGRARNRRVEMKVLFD